MEREKPQPAANAVVVRPHSIKPIGGAAKMLITRKDREKERARVREIEVSRGGRMESTFGVYPKAIIRLHLAKLP